MNERNDAQWTETLLETTLREDWPSIQSLIEERYNAKPAQGILSEMAHAHFETGGKRLRALIPAAIFRILKTPLSKVARFPAAIEILHNATLVHDDLQDGDETRRGQPTIWKKYGPAQAINSGDAHFFYAMALLADVEAKPETLVELMRIFSHSSLEVIRGQAEEFVEKEHLSQATTENYLSIVEGKTGGLLALPLRGSALLALGDLRYDTLLESIGLLLGTVFQIQDDLLDIVGKKGREIEAADIAEGKPSFLAIHALQNGHPQDRKRLLEILTTPRMETTAEAVQEGIQILKRSGSISAGFEEIEHLEQRLHDLTQEITEPELRRFLRGLTARFLRPIEEAKTHQG